MDEDPSVTDRLKAIEERLEEMAKAIRLVSQFADKASSATGSIIKEVEGIKEEMKPLLNVIKRVFHI